ncbi:porin [Cupriavidus sp. IK-TO18]|uniref:porin n=1 Tax=Cupriavidus sp. IK-TO18 TaxID=2782182 RepID=UPI001897EE24|nr:porin [Cupriavidus sp. IK-TO18]MBF6992494.1 porin [Cupriavidus sp. IK-TO18]
MLHHPGRPQALIQAAALVTCLASFSSPANAVELYGIVDSYLASTKASGEAGNVVGIQSGGMSTAFWGMTGAEDLGNGLKANFRLEGYFFTDTGTAGRLATDTLHSRNAYVGLEGRLGEVRLGRLSNPMFLATSQFDAFGGSTKFSPILNPLWAPQYGRYIAGDTGWNNAIGYYTPEVGGLSGRFVYGLGEAAGTNSSNNAVAMLFLDRKPLTATAAYQRTRVGPGFPTGSWAQSVCVGAAAYDFQWAKAFLEYVGTRASGGARFRTDTFHIGTTIPAGPGRVMAAAVQTNIRADGQAGTWRRDIGLGYLYSFSKRTDGYVNVLYDKLSDKGSGTSAGIGIRHKF